MPLPLKYPSYSNTEGRVREPYSRGQNTYCPHLSVFGSDHCSLSRRENTHVLNNFNLSWSIGAVVWRLYKQLTYVRVGVTR